MEKSVWTLSQVPEPELSTAVHDVWLQVLLGGSGRLSPMFIASMLLICVALYYSRKPGQGFWAWVFPRDVYRTTSFWVDAKLWLLGTVLAGVGVFSIVGFGPAIAQAIQTSLMGANAPQSTWPPFVVGFILMAAADFSSYWVHRISHEWPRLWPFHAVHHSAEVLNPITVNRKHPVYSLFSSLCGGVVIGTTQGLLLGLLIGEIEIATIMGANLFYYAFHLAGANLRHTHIWLSFGRMAEHLVISPAQHQVHHSLDPRHFNKNYGEVLAIWDWMFGSLYVPQGYEELKFGLADGRGRPVKQPHPTLRAALWEPFVTAFRRKRPRTQMPEQPRVDQD
ncbi:sterol desaturase family protein [Aliiroseovarius subalbicans]|uniref:sterol desaturase family protein n=1 Tax=Aliiroseovarius subalbicans TaxID=2925840 RepID=UPI001F560F04|nr:sterol desaturase family protein [Aliiroseovarius subalbicans]MCI2398710.1 sterol desaturase family protein [Aliiroseovarius subalbicans]